MHVKDLKTKVQHSKKVFKRDKSNIKLGWRTKTSSIIPENSEIIGDKRGIC